MRQGQLGWAALAFSLLVGMAGCARKAADLTPEGAVRDLLDRIDRVEADPVQARAVYELLSSRTKANLVERARRASTTSGRAVHPEEMLAPGRFSLRFEPRKMHARIAESEHKTSATMPSGLASAASPTASSACPGQYFSNASWSERSLRSRS